jgi:APA family basic amino acid/polyamine antiporter
LTQPLEKPARRRGLKRTIGIGGLFSIGYADVGAGIYLALGLVSIHAGYATPLAIGAAAIAYVLTGLTYAELSSTYPRAGGSATFAQAAFGDDIGFLAGWMLCLDYVVTAAIFAIPAIAYLSYFAPALNEPFWLGIGAILLLGGLVFLNVIGIRESVNFTLGLALLDIISEVALIILGLVLVLIPGGLLFTWPSKFQLFTNPTLPEFVQGITLAMVSYLGIEALAQAAEETKIAGRTVPRATMATLGSVVILYLLISVVAVNVVPPMILSTTFKNDPLSGVARSLPGAGSLIAIWIALLGCSISIIGANAGIIGSSRTLYALSKYKMLPGKFGAIHPKFRTPWIAIIVFGLGSIVLVAFASFGSFTGSEDPLVLLGSLYNVGALVAYVSAHASLIVTRNTDRPRFRPFRVPLTLRFKRKAGVLELPILPLLGLLATSAIWVAVILTHELGRELGIVWVVMGMGMYVYFRRKNRLPLRGRAPPEPRETSSPGKGEGLIPSG